MIKILLLVGILLVSALGLESIQAEQMYFSEQNPKVNVWFVEYSSEIPCAAPPGHILYGCSFYYENRYKEDTMYVLEGNHIDKYGLTAFEHEKLHIECNCAWHYGNLGKVMQKQNNVYDLVMENIWSIKMIENYYKNY